MISMVKFVLRVSAGRITLQLRKRGVEGHQALISANPDCENVRPKRLLAESVLDNAVLKDVGGRTW
jgi:hypothetical protein